LDKNAYFEVQTNYLTSKLPTAKKEIGFWKLLNVFDNKVRIDIVRLLLQVEWRSLSDIAAKLAEKGRKMSLPGVLKHLKELEKTGIVRRESGAFMDKPDARKAIYMLEGKERVQKILDTLEKDVGTWLTAGLVFAETARLARRIQGMGSRATDKEKKRLTALLAECESETIREHLTEDEKKKLKLWKTMLSL